MARRSFARLEENDFKSSYFGVQDPGRSRETGSENGSDSGWGSLGGRLSKGFLHSLTASYEDVKMQKSMPNVTQIPKLNRQGLSKGST